MANRPIIHRLKEVFLYGDRIVPFPLMIENRDIAIENLCHQFITIYRARTSSNIYYSKPIVLTSFTPEPLCFHSVLYPKTGLQFNRSG